MKLLPFDYAVRNLGRSRTRLALSVFGSALVAILILAAAGFVRGMTGALRSTGDADNVMILGAGSEESIERSEIDARTAGLVAASLPGIRSREGAPYLSAEVHVQLPLRTRPDQPKGPMVLTRGVTPGALLVHSNVQIVEGRFPTPGNDEVMVGATLPTKLAVAPPEVAIGKQLLIDKRMYTIVGRFVAPGSVMEAEVWAPLTDLKEATKRITDSCVIITLAPDKPGGEFADVAAFTKTRVDLELAALRETSYYARLANFFGPVRAVTWITAGLIALGGLLGGLNTMYAAFAARVRELGTLQSLGFRRSAIVISLIQESTLATTAGSLIACAIALLFLDGLAVRFSMGAFGITIDSPVLAVGLGAGVALGLFGALPPAWRCLRLPIPVALKAV
jgi:hypothetical protein